MGSEAIRNAVRCGNGSGQFGLTEQRSDGPVHSVETHTVASPRAGVSVLVITGRRRLSVCEQGRCSPVVRGGLRGIETAADHDAMA